MPVSRTLENARNLRHQMHADSLHAILPSRGIAAAVETGDDDRCRVVVNDEHPCVGETSQQGAADDFVSDGKLPGIGAHGLYHSVDGHAETPAQAGSLVLISILRVDHFSAGGLGEDNRMHYGQRCSSSAFNAVQLMPSLRSW